MFVGLLTAPVEEWSFKKLVDWASKNGFKGLEVHVSQASNQINIEKVIDGGAGEVRKALQGKDVKITSLAFYSYGILESAGDQLFLGKILEAASVLDVGVVCTFAGAPVKGKDKRQTLEEDFPKVFQPLVDKAKGQGIKLAMENWFATNLQGLEHFELAFKSVPDLALGLNFDPSHLLWQQIDYLEAVRNFGKRIYHTHAKDTEILGFKLRRVGVLDSGWWRYRIPGRGSVDWNAYITALKEVNYDYVLSIEHEDPFFPPEDGFIDGRKFLERLIF